MKSFLINLPDHTERRLKSLATLDAAGIEGVEIVEACDCRKLSPEQLAERFDFDRAKRHGGFSPLPAEVGCTISHIDCYRLLLESDADYAGIFEDDIVLSHSTPDLLGTIERTMAANQRPTVLLLSGDYLYSGGADEQIVDVAYAEYTHAYAINRAAAETILNSAANRPWWLADDWELFRDMGINLIALHPHIFDQDSATESTIKSPVHRRSFTLAARLRRYWNHLRLSVQLRFGRLHREE